MGSGLNLEGHGGSLDRILGRMREPLVGFEHETDVAWFRIFKDLFGHREETVRVWTGPRGKASQKNLPALRGAVWNLPMDATENTQGCLSRGVAQPEFWNGHSWWS